MAPYPAYDYEYSYDESAANENEYEDEEYYDEYYDDNHPPTDNGLPFTSPKPVLHTTSKPDKRHIGHFVDSRPPRVTTLGDPNPTIHRNVNRFNFKQRPQSLYHAKVCQ